MSKNRYFFGGELKSAIKSKSSRGPKEKGPKPRKTAVDIFLEDQGPYSRKLYGPAPNGGGGEGKFATVCLHFILIYIIYSIVYQCPDASKIIVPLPNFVYLSSFVYI